jgi:hypothetical protein
MGFDVSYHPISEAELKDWYFSALEDDFKVDLLGAQYRIDPFYIEKYRGVIKAGRDAASDSYFDKTHAFFAAIVQGFFRSYFYTRGAAFSSLVDAAPSCQRFTKSWEDILGREIGQPVQNRIVENYCGGVYIPAEQVKLLLDEIGQDTGLRGQATEFFGDGTIEVFLKALDFAAKNDLGILEATEVITPDPLDLNKSQSYSNIYNCDKDGVLLYADTTARQIAEAIAAEEQQGTEPTDDALAQDKDEGDKAAQRPGFLKRLFGFG